jgi:hypothetical protein
VPTQEARQKRRENGEEEGWWLSGERSRVIYVEADVKTRIT